MEETVSLHQGVELNTRTWGALDCANLKMIRFFVIGNLECCLLRSTPGSLLASKACLSFLTVLD